MLSLTTNVLNSTAQKRDRQCGGFSEIRSDSWLGLREQRISFVSCAAQTDPIEAREWDEGTRCVDLIARIALARGILKHHLPTWMFPVADIARLPSGGFAEFGHLLFSVGKA